MQTALNILLKRDEASTNVFLTHNCQDNPARLRKRPCDQKVWFNWDEG